MTNSQVLSKYSKLLKSFLSKEIDNNGFIKGCDEINTETNLKKQFELNDIEYIAFIILAIYEIEGGLDNIKTLTIAHLFSIISQIYSIDYNIFELLTNDSAFAKLIYYEEKSPLISAAVSLKKEILFHITCNIPISGESNISITSDAFHGEEIKKQISLLCCFAANKEKIFEKFGLSGSFFYGNTTSALFHGASGTGKTMAAHIVANNLGLPLMKVELSDIFNKYIGETEKHIKEIFDRAEKSNAVLLFDEADALFSKRTEINSSHDKYANLSTSFLLQKIEEYAGVVILTTNLSANLDEAFLRRIQFVIRFPLLGESERREYWKRMLGSSIEYITDEDIQKFAEKELSPARIKEIVKMSAVLAFHANAEIIKKEHIETAIKQELEKNGRKA